MGIKYEDYVFTFGSINGYEMWLGVEHVVLMVVVGLMLIWANRKVIKTINRS